MPVLSTENLTKEYYRRPVVDNVNITVSEGDIYGFVGRNGAGKTTLIRMVAGLAKKTSGSYTLFGVPDSERRIDLVRRRMRVVVESATLYPSLNAVQNLTLQCKLLREDTSCISRLLGDVRLENAASKPVKNFSLGMRHRLQIAMAMVGDPGLLLLDEPTNGLDPEGIFQVRELLVRLNRERGVTILVSSHILGELSKFATCYGFIERGRLIKEISAEELHSECRSFVRVRTRDIALAESLLKARGLRYTVLAEGVDVTGVENAGELVTYLTGSGVNVCGFDNLEGDLERYFLDLIGGGYEKR